MNQAEKYIADVVEGRIVTGEDVKLAVKKHLNDLETGEERGFYFDKAHAEQILSLCGLFKYAKGADKGKPFVLADYHAFLTYVAFGWKRRKDGLRKYNKIYHKIARKGAKTEYLALIANILLFFGGQPTAEAWWGATKRDQAKIGLRRQMAMAKMLISSSPYMAENWRVSQTRIFNKDGDAFADALGKDSDTEDGWSPYAGLIDEYHAHPNNDIVNILESGMGAYGDAMLWIITTAGLNAAKSPPCLEFEQLCKQILRGIVVNEDIFPLIFDLDAGDDWNDKNVWGKANPLIGITPTWRFMESRYEKAKIAGMSAETDFKAKNLNIWVNAEETWIPDEIWTNCRVDFSPEDLIGKKAIGGLDLASVRDMTGFGLVFPDAFEVGRDVVLVWYWVPEDLIEERESQGKDLPSYRQWVRDGLLLTTPGNVLDYSAPRAKIKELRNIYDFDTIQYDRWGAYSVIIDLEADGFKVNRFGQGTVSMNPAMKEFERRVYGKKDKDDPMRLLQHNGHPILRWNVANLIALRDPAGNMKPDRSNVKNKIDGAVCVIMGLGGLLNEEPAPGPSKYESEELTVV
ncbi:MAG: terminase large subunit [Saprospirales bacterium]|nr:terminase large subunit [Saprospirales bacterium]